MNRAPTIMQNHLRHISPKMKNNHSKRKVFRLKEMLLFTEELWTGLLNAIRLVLMPRPVCYVCRAANNGLIDWKHSRPSTLFKMQVSSSLQCEECFMQRHRVSESITLQLQEYSQNEHQSCK